MDQFISSAVDGLTNVFGNYFLTNSYRIEKDTDSMDKHSIPVELAEFKHLKEYPTLNLTLEGLKIELENIGWLYSAWKKNMSIEGDQCLYVGECGVWSSSLYRHAKNNEEYKKKINMLSSNSNYLFEKHVPLDSAIEDVKARMWWEEWDYFLIFPCPQKFERLLFENVLINYLHPSHNSLQKASDVQILTESSLAMKALNNFGLSNFLNSKESGISDKDLHSFKEGFIDQLTRELNN